jgi:hypothetical protein
MWWTVGQLEELWPLLSERSTWTLLEIAARLADGYSLRETSEVVGLSVGVAHERMHALAAELERLARG